MKFLKTMNEKQKQDNGRRRLKTKGRKLEVKSLELGNIINGKKSKNNH